MLYQWLTVFGYLPVILQAALLAIEVTILAFVLALALGVVAALGRNSRFKILRLGAGVYVEVIRNTPVLLQIFVAFFAVPSLGINIDAFSAGVMALGVNVGAYLCEVFRAGISSVSKGQLEAARILGLGEAQVFTYVVLPQALRNVYPAVINNLIQILLGTSLLSAIALPELTGMATILNARTLIFLPIFTITLLIYLILSNALSLIGAAVGKRIFKPALIMRRSTLGTRFAVRRVGRPAMGVKK
ncbi:MAG: amino acid ABC transporter permease [Microbacteriaceae bacterium]|nr:MAG: amino acid ABC transporter permease [Microbacteriaceae bacterium]